MKRKRICISGTALAIVLTVYLFLAFGLCSAAPHKIEPTGTNISVVQFDAVIELNRYFPHSLRHDYTVIFARYWVARDYYGAAVVWAEPQSTDLFFAVHPLGLSVASNQQSFSVSQESTKKYDRTYKKHLGERGVFRYKYGSYSINDIRFAEQEALAARIYAADLERLQDVNQTHTETLDLSKSTCEAGAARSMAKLRVQASARRIDSMELLDAKEQLLKSINYEYGNNAGKAYLRRQIVTLPERPMSVGFKGEGIKVTLDGKEYRYRELEATHHAGGRRCTVKYEPVTLGGKKVPLPVRVTVRGGKDGHILRSVHLTNFKKVEFDAAGVEQAAGRFAAVTPDERQYEELRLKYWKKAPNEEIKGEDREAIEQLWDRTQIVLISPDKTVGEKLKALNVLMELRRMLGDVPELERCYQRYLSTLSENKLFPLTLVGGYGVIETAMFRARRNEAGMLLDRWVDKLLQINDADSVLLFAKRQLSKKRLWTTVALLEKLSVKRDLHADVRFEADVLRCTALVELCKLLQASDLAEKGLFAKVEADWVAAVGMDNLKTMLTNGISQASRFFVELPAPTEPQHALKQQLDKISQEVKKEEENKDSAD